MGDRANIQIVEEQGGVLFLYTHWSGHELPQTLASALDRGRSRWDDEAYLSRIIFSELIKDDVEGETGYGLSTYRGDDNHPDLIVDCKTKTVGGRGEDLTFDQFIAKFGK